MDGIPSLREAFNRWSDRRRILMVLSPSCGDCRAGFDLVSREVGLSRGFVLWSALREGDDVALANSIATSSRHPQIEHFWEDEGWPLSTRLRPLLGLGPFDPTRSAWDVYLLYRPGRRWSGSDPAAPDDWAHNLVVPPPGAKRLTDDLMRAWTSEV